MNNVIRAILLQDTRVESDWMSDSTIIPEGKQCFSSDKGNAYKIGDGVHTWSELAYNTAIASDVPSWAKNPSKPTYTKSEIGLGNVENKSGSTIRGEMTKAEVVKALGYTPPTKDTTYSVFTGSTSSADGTIGLVPLPSKGYNSNRFLKADGTWAVPPNTTYNVATESSNGLMSSSDKVKLNGIAENANNYIHPSYTNKANGLYKITVDSTGHVSAVTAVSKADITALGIPAQDTTYNVATTTTDGLMSGEDKSKLDGIATGANNYSHPTYTAKNSGLYKITVDKTGHVSAVTAVSKADITALGIPSTNTTYSDMVGATSDANGSSGLVPAPASGASDRYLRSDGTWVVPPNTTYNVATTSANGLMSKDDKSKLDGIANGANKYVHPSYTNRTSGLYKITVDSTGHVSDVTAVVKADITGLGIPAQDTTYSAMTGATSSANGTSGLVPAPVKGSANRYLRSDGTWVVPPNTTYKVATTSANGLMSKDDKSKLDGIEANANNYTHPTYTAKNSGLYKITVDATGHVSAVTAVSKADITALGIPAQDTNTTYSDMVGATSSANGSSGLVPAPASGASNRYLRSDGTWAVPPDTNTTYNVATTSANGLMSKDDKAKLDGIASGANNYSHPSYTNRASGLYKITVDNTGHVSAVTAVAKADITALGIPAQDTTYGSAGSSLGLVKSGGDVTISSGVITVKDDSHQHSDSTITSLDASKLTGTIDIARLPKGALERCVVVADDTARFALTTDSVQIGDTVKVTSTSKMYFVVDDSKLGEEAGYEVYTAGSATSVPWSGVTDKPSTFTPSTHNHTISQITDIANASVDKATKDGSGNVIASTYIKSASCNGKVITFTKGDGSTFTITTQDTTYSAMTGATTSANGASGLVPAPAKGSANRYLRSDGTWAVPPDTNTTYNVATTSANGLMSKEDKSKLDGIATGANNYVHPSYTAKSSGLYKITVDATGHVSGVTAVSKADITALGIPAQDTNTTYSAMTGATTSADGTSGLVPIPTKGSANRYLRSDGTWSVPPDTNTTYNVATTSANGLMSSSDKSKLDGIATGANKYTHPSYTNRASGLYKITVDATGHVSAVTAVTKADITALGIPAQDTNTTYSDMVGATADANGSSGLVPAPASGASNRYLRSDGTWVVPPNTTYNVATTSANGLMSKEDKSKLDGIASGANKYTHPSYTAKSSGLYKVTIDATGHVSAVTAVSKSDITALGIPAQDTTYSTMTGATTSANGTSGLVPAPASGASNRYLRSDGTWVVPPNTTYNVATTSTNGLMSSTDKAKLDGIASGANNYTLPTASSSVLGGVKTTSTVTNTSGLTACPIIDGVVYYKDTNTTYGSAGSSLGLVKSGGDVTISSGVITVNDDSHNHVISNVDGLQDALNGKAPTSHTHSNYLTTTGKAKSAESADTALGLTKSKAIYDAIFPVGIVLPFANTTDPNDIFTGTTWEAFADGKTLIGAGTYNDDTTSKTFAVGDTGGKYKVALASGNLPSHNHSISLSVKREAITVGSGSTTGYIPATGTQTTATYSNSGTTGNTGSGTAFEVLTPYVAVKFWKRTA